jgi:hypothetical protein
MRTSRTLMTLLGAGRHLRHHVLIMILGIGDRPCAPYPTSSDAIHAQGHVTL